MNHATPGHDDQDLTSRARIRDTAMRLFAERGFTGASVRDIADAAGVSAGLVQHHFTSKAALRQACDERAVSLFRATKQGSLSAEQMSSPMFLSTAYRDTLPAIRYLARALAEGSPGAQRLFDEMVAMYQEEIGGGSDHGYAIETEDLQAFTTVLVAQMLGLMVLNQHASRVLGVDILTPDGHPRVARAMLEIASQTLISREFAATGLETLRQYQAAPPDPGEQET